MKLNDKLESVVAGLKMNLATMPPTYSCRQVATRFSCTENIADKALTALVAAGLVKKDGRHYAR